MLQLSGSTTPPKVNDFTHGQHLLKRLPCELVTSEGLQNVPWQSLSFRSSQDVSRLKCKGTFADPTYNEELAGIADAVTDETAATAMRTHRNEIREIKESI